jgi:hypothetical protein
LPDRRLQIGETENGEPFTLPADIAVQASATMGKRGTGKTVTASVLVEEMLKLGLHVVILDPVDVWWGLKASGGGEEEGFPILTLGGSHGDLPLEAEHGKRLADFAVEERVPMILSLRHLRKGQQRSFVTDFAEQLYHRKGEPEHRVPLHLVVDEASRFIPQRVSGALARSVGAFEDIVRQGRADGFGVNLIDQRPASVNKNVLSQVDTLVVHQVTSTHDRKALSDWVDQHDVEDRGEEFRARLASLELGQAWFWDPSLDVFELVSVRMRETFDSSSTPDLGEEVVLPEKMASVDLDELRDALEEQIEEAERNDPERLRERIEELEAEKADLEETPREVVPDDHVSREEVQEQIDSAVATAREEGRAEMEGHVATLEGRLSEIGDRAETIREAAADIVEIARKNGRPEVPQRDVEDAPEASGVSGETRSIETPEPPPERRDARTVLREPEPRHPELSGPEQRVLNALATLRYLGESEPENAQLAAFAGYKPGGYWRSIRGGLSTDGLLEYPEPGRVRLTEKGDRFATAAEIESLDDVHALFFDLADGPQSKLLRVLIDVYPEALPSDELAERSGYSPGGYFRSIRGKLSTWGVLEYPEQGMVRATEILFPEELD